MIEASLLALAFGAGMVATVNPCGFAMLPAYLSFFLGTDDGSDDTGTGILRALAVGVCVSGGFLAVFAVVGVLITQFSLSLERYLPWVTIVVGVGVLVLGVAMLRGFEPTIRLPKLERGTANRGLGSMFLFGVSYAIASLSCSIGVFLTYVSVTFTQRDFWSGMQVFVAYALGMAVVLMFVTLALALAKQSLVRTLRGALPYVNRVAGALLVLAGAYLTYYGWYELRVRSGDTSGGGPAQAVFDLNGSISDWVQRTGAGRIGLVLGGVVLAAAIVAAGLRSARPREHDRSEGGTGSRAER